MDFDLVLVGGGLQNALIALACRHYAPHLRLGWFEQADQIGGNHTWSFHSHDVPPPSWDWFAPLQQYQWPAHWVHFPTYSRRLESTYASFTADHLRHTMDQVLADWSHLQLYTEQEVFAVGEREIRLSSGDTIAAGLVIDATGPKMVLDPSRSGFQKFVGWEVELDLRQSRQPLPSEPWLMDARVTQVDGYRFFYVLPFDEQTALIEDTYFSENPALDVAQVAVELEHYLSQQGWCVARQLRQEVGVLPMPWRWLDQPTLTAPLRAGYRGGWFHPATGYSLPVAVRLAEQLGRHLAQSPAQQKFVPVALVTQPRITTNHTLQGRFESLTTPQLMDGLTVTANTCISPGVQADATPPLAELTSAALATSAWQQSLRPVWRWHHRQARACLWLNWMLFWFWRPAQRWQVFARFYRMPVAAISRFYALELSWRDWGRIVRGWPPTGFSVQYALTRRENSTHGR